MKPNLFIIGAMKSGTTSLACYLAMHPQIGMSAPKEPKFFSGARYWNPEFRAAIEAGDDPMAAYLRLFSGMAEKTYACEASTLYTWWPHIPNVARQVHHLNSDARLIYILRDPVERAISHYWFSTEHNWESGPPSTLRENPLYWNVSNYAMQLREYLRFFPREQIHILTLEELNAEPAKTMSALFGWLGLDLPDGHSDELFSEHANVGPKEVAHADDAALAFRNSRLFRAVHRLVPRQLRRFVWQRIKTRRSIPSLVNMDKSVKFLRGLMVPHALELEELWGRRFREWRTVWGNPSDWEGIELAPFQTTGLGPQGCSPAPGSVVLTGEATT